MTEYLIFGLGMMGEAICHDLLQFDKGATIHLIEISEERINEIKSRFSTYDDQLIFHKLSIDDKEEVMQILDSVDVAFGAIDYKYNLVLTEICISTSTHFLDLGGNPNIVEEQYKLSSKAMEAGITVIPDCGLAPGMVNVIASALIQQFDDPLECHIRVGGLPKDPKGILRYQQVFSIRGLTNEYKEDAIVIRDGDIKYVPSLSELETLYFPEPFGAMEAFQTAGGTSSLPSIYEGTISELTYKTIRYPGHMQYFRFLLEFDLLSEEEINGISPREIIERQLVKYLPRGEPDVVLIRIYVLGNFEGKQRAITWQTIDNADIEHNISAMGRTTAYPISIIGQMLAHQEITEVGVQPGELVVPIDKFVEELEKRSITFTKTDEIVN